MDEGCRFSSIIISVLAWHASSINCSLREKFDRQVRGCPCHVGHPAFGLAKVASRRDRPSTEGCAAFDDGYADLVEHALPDFAAPRIWSTVVFIVTGQVGGTNDEAR